MRLQVEDAPGASPPRPRTPTDKPIAEVFHNYQAPLAKVIAIARAESRHLRRHVFIAVYFSSVLGFSKGAASTVVLVAVLLAAALIPMVGLLGNRFGGKRILVISFAAYVLLTLPAFMLMNQALGGRRCSVSRSA